MPSPSPLYENAHVKIALMNEPRVVVFERTAVPVAIEELAVVYDPVERVGSPGTELEFAL